MSLLVDLLGHPAWAGIAVLIPIVGGIIGYYLKTRQQWVLYVITFLIVLFFSLIGLSVGYDIQKSESFRIIATSESAYAVAQAYIATLEAKPPVIQSPETIEIEVTRILTVEVTKEVEVFITPDITPYPTNTFYPTSTPYPTNTPYPTYTPYIPPLPTAIPTPSALFQDDFRNNSNSWDLSGDARISSGKMVLAVPRGELGWVSAPNVVVPENFYMQAEVAYVEGNCYGGYGGLGLGEASGNRYQFVVYMGCGDPDKIVVLDNGTVQSWTSLDRDVESTPVILKLEVRNGTYTFSIDGQYTEIFTLDNRYGSNVGLVAASSGGIGNVGSRGDVEFSFDNFIVREIVD